MTFDASPPDTLADLRLVPLPLGSIKPRGWLLGQLELQRDGLTGHLDAFWPDVAQSQWVGGAAEGWERGPYWLDGVVPLAYLLDDARLKEKVTCWIGEILARQHPDGWFGPRLDPRHSYEHDPWPVFVVFKAFTQYVEATGDPRIIPAMTRFLHCLNELLQTQWLRSWARYRWADLVVSIYWLYERNPEPWLLDLTATLQGQGFDWRAHYARFPFRGKVRREECDLSSHGVNNAMGLKAPGVWSRQSGDVLDRAAPLAMMEVLQHYHGQATGMFSCDEHLAGTSPVQGSELCAVVEYMYSLEVLLCALGAPEFADRLESLAYNALPATLSPDIWAHQYDQQVNQVLCRHAPVHPLQAREPEDDTYPWTSNGPDANVFGLEPHFGCCTANMHQGWPKFASHLWLRSPDGGLAAVAYARSVVRVEIGGGPVTVELATEYPFDGRLSFEVHTAVPVTFPLYLRVPGWAAGATVRVGEAEPTPAAAGTFHAVAGEWVGTTRVTLELPMRWRMVERQGGAFSLYRGPLLFALKVGESWQHLRGEAPHNDWEVHPTSAWNYALALNLDDPEASLRLESRAAEGQPFTPETAPLIARVRGKRVPGWELVQNSAGPLPHPLHTAKAWEELELLPYACARLRIAEFPVLPPDEGT